MTDQTETRALKALYRNHPSTAPGDRYGEKARRRAHGQRVMLLAWAAEQPDYRLLDCRNIGATTLAWTGRTKPKLGPNRSRPLVQLSTWTGSCARSDSGMTSILKGLPPPSPAPTGRTPHDAHLRPLRLAD